MLYKKGGQYRSFARFVFTPGVLALTLLSAQAAPVTLGQAADFGVLAGSTITNTGNSVVFGDVGVSPSVTITGFPPGLTVGGSLHLNDATTQQAQSDLMTAYDAIAGETFTQDLTGQDLGSRTLTPGVYRFDTTATLTGILVLDAQGDSNARFDFQIGSALTTISSSSVLMVNGGLGSNVFFQVGSSATLGTGTTFTGSILALTSITLANGASIYDGRALARNGAVTMDANTIRTPSAVAGVPEPSLGMFLSGACLPLAVLLVRRRNKGNIK